VTLPDLRPERIVAARRRLVARAAEAAARAGGGLLLDPSPAAPPAEGGCGVVGLACDVPVAGRHLLGALGQMRNRGNGKGGGVAMVGLDPAQLGVDAAVLRDDYLLGVAYLDAGVRAEVEERFIAPVYHVDAVRELTPAVADPGELGLEVRPPDVALYFVRPRQEALERLHAEVASAEGAPPPAGGRTAPARSSPRARPAPPDPPSPPELAALADELVYQSSFRLNVELYAGGRGNLAYVQCHAKDLLVLKMVGYAEDVVRWYGLEDMTAHVWIGHHRYPTKGRVWHPGGAHPFVGLNEALVHNGDFANYQSICDYLAQRGIRPLFMTDTEVAALVYDLHRRVYRYPLEYVIESLAPTTERDFALLPPDKRQVYRALQTAHIHGSPDGPWFFIIAESLAGEWRLIGVTDTSMLRPQVFALQRGAANIAFCASEKQVIDAVLASLAREDPRFWSRPDRTWVARGGSHTDGGAFVFTLRPRPDGGRELLACDKFGAAMRSAVSGDAATPALPGAGCGLDVEGLLGALPSPAFSAVTAALRWWSWDEAVSFLVDLRRAARAPELRAPALALLTRLLDRRYDTGGLRRSRWLSRLDDCLVGMLADLERHPGCGFAVHAGPGARPLPERPAREHQPLAPLSPLVTLVLDARRYPTEGEGSAASELVALHRAGWQRFLVAQARGHRFLGCGFGPTADGARIDIYGSAGDYLASGSDGLELHLHGDGQDQLAQIFRHGTLVVHGDVGQAFGYGAKGGEAYVLGNAAGRPMINAVGSPRVVINGTCLDYLAESFMAGDPLRGGGFVILNGVGFDERGELRDLDEPYPGGNLFSLASGGALYIRDPHGRLEESQLNGGEFAELTAADWDLVRPYLEKNAEHFDVLLASLLTAGGRERPPAEVYRKVCPVKHRALQAEEAWVGHRG
jgi:glutamate synthase domain-containing protein 1/glutamate synthase domain-containing protein 3